MKNIHPYMVITLIVMIGLTACSKQNWYQGMHSAQIAKCMDEPAAEFDDCKQQSNESYESYERNRKSLSKDSLE